MVKHEKNDTQNCVNHESSIVKKIRLLNGGYWEWMDSWLPFMILFLGGLAIPFLFDPFYQLIWSNAPSLAMRNTVTDIVCILWGLAGIPFIVKKEVPPIIWISIRGVPAVLFGIFCLLFWGGLGAAGIIHTLLKIFF